MDILELPEIIEQERKRQKIEIKDLCYQADISQPTYYHWMNRRTEPCIYTLSRVMDVLNMKIEVIKEGA